MMDDAKAVDMIEVIGRKRQHLGVPNQKIDGETRQAKLLRCQFLSRRCQVDTHISRAVFFELKTIGADPVADLEDAFSFEIFKPGNERDMRFMRITPGPYFREIIF